MEADHTSGITASAISDRFQVLSGWIINNHYPANLLFAAGTPALALEAISSAQEDVGVRDYSEPAEMRAATGNPIESVPHKKLESAVTASITYTYDPLYRLPRTDYSDGITFRSLHL